MTRHNRNAVKLVKYQTVLILIGLLWFSLGPIPRVKAGGMLRAIGSATSPVTTTTGEAIANDGAEVIHYNPDDGTATYGIVHPDRCFSYTYKCLGQSGWLIPTIC